MLTEHRSNCRHCGCSHPPGTFCPTTTDAEIEGYRRFIEGFSRPAAPEILIDHGSGDCTAYYVWPGRAVHEAQTAEREARERWLSELDRLSAGAYDTAIEVSLMYGALDWDFIVPAPVPEPDRGAPNRGDRLPRQAVEDWCSRQPGVVSCEIEWLPADCDGRAFALRVTLHEREGVRKLSTLLSMRGDGEWEDYVIDDLLDDLKGGAKLRQREGLPRFSDRMIRGSW